MKVNLNDLQSKVMTLQEALQALHQAEADSIYVELREIEPGKYIFPPSLLDIHANRYGKIHNEYGQKVQPSGGMGLAEITTPVAAGGMGSLPIPLAAYDGFDARDTDYEFLIHYISVSHNDLGNNRQLSMRYENATMGCNIIPPATITIPPALEVLVYPHVRDSAGAYHPTYPGGWGAVVVDGVNVLTLEVNDLANGFLVDVRVVYSSMVFD